MSSTIDIPCGVFLDVPAEQEVLFHDNNDGSSAASAGPPKGRQHDSDDHGGSDTDVSGAARGMPVPPTSGSQALHDGVEDDEGYPDNIEDFMATLLDGMRSDSVQLATSARNVVANTYQVGVAVVLRYFFCGKQERSVMEGGKEASLRFLHTIAPCSRCKYTGVASITEVHDRTCLLGLPNCAISSTYASKFLHLQ